MRTRAHQIRLLIGITLMLFGAAILFNSQLFNVGVKVSAREILLDMLATVSLFVAFRLLVGGVVWFSRLR